VTADLELVVRATEVFQFARPESSGPGHPCGTGGNPADRTDSPGTAGPSSRPAEIAAGSLAAGQVQLTGDTNRHGLEVAVHDVRPQVAQRSPDRRCVSTGDPRRGGVDGGFGGAVEVVAGRVGSIGQPPPLGVGSASPPSMRSRGRCRSSVSSPAGSSCGRKSVSGRGSRCGVRRRTRRELAVHPDCLVDDVQLVAGGHQHGAFEGGVER